MLLTCLTILSAVASALICVLGGVSFWWLPLLLIGCFLGGLAVAFGFLWLMCALVDFDKPQEHDSKFYRFLAKIYIEALVPLVRVHIHKRGLEKLPKEGPYMMVCNHQSIADPVILLEAFPKAELTFISKKENHDMFLIGKIMHKLMCQLLDRENDRQALKVILRCIQLVRDEKMNLAVFPEGWCTLDGRLQHFRPGVFKIAQKTKVPIVVCTVNNTQQIFDNLPKLRRTDVDLHLLEVIRPEEYEGLTTVQLADKVFQMMLDDLGPEYAPLEPKEEE
jgi:1-acyl-sn-glycerol-3-phosphate acyltransferase